MGCCNELCAGCCLLRDSFSRISLETLMVSTQYGTGPTWTLALMSTPSYVQIGDTVAGTSTVDSKKYYWYVDDVSGSNVTVRFLFSDAENPADLDPQSNVISELTVKRLGTEYYTDTTKANYLWGVTDDECLVSNAGASSTLFISDADELYSYVLEIAGSGRGDSSDPDHLRVRSSCDASSANYNQTQLTFSDCTDCQDDYRLVSTLVQGSSTTEVCPPDISNLGILPASDGKLHGQIANDDGVVFLRYCIKQQNSGSISTSDLSFVALVGPSIEKPVGMQNGSGYGDGVSGMGDKAGISLDASVKCHSVQLSYTDQSDPDDNEPACPGCISWQCGDATDIAWLDSRNRDETDLLVIDGTASFDGTTVTVGSSQVVKLASQMGIRSYTEPDGTLQDNYTNSPVRIGLASDIEVRGNAGDQIVHGWTLVIGDADGDGGSINGESYPVKSQTWYRMRWCSTFQTELDSGSVAAAAFVEAGFIEEIDGSLVY